MILNKSKVLIKIMWIKIKKISFPIYTRNNIFILIVCDKTIFFCFFSIFIRKTFLKKLRIWWKNFTIFYLILCDIVKFIFATKKNNVILIWQKIQFIFFLFIPGKDTANPANDKSNWYAAPFSNNNWLFIYNFFILSNSPP